MKVEHRPVGAATFAQWNEALLQVLLPELLDERVGAPVLVACDDEAVLSAAELLGLPRDDAVAHFGHSVETRYRLAATGSVDRVRGDTVRFRNDPDRAKLVPPFLGVCAVMVLAASRMTSADGMSTGNYYERLWETLGRRPQSPSPYEFDYAPWLFRYLAEWLENDLGGHRGLLVLAGGGPTYIGCAINQCVFRERDKEHLADFFADRVGRRAVNLDLLRLLQISGHRHALTHRAQQAIADPILQPLARAALAHELERWDGTRPDAGGGRSWQGMLHLSVNRGMQLSVSAPDAPPDWGLDGGHTMQNRVALALEDLPNLAERGRRYGLPGHPGVSLRPAGDTLVFEVSEDSGLVWVRAPSQALVHVLSRDQALQRALADYLSEARGAGSLPKPWQLFERVPVARLPVEIGALASASARSPVALRGGLRVDRSSWLVGFSPRIEVGAVEESLNVAVDGEPAGEVAAGCEMVLKLPEGDHRIDVADGLASFVIHSLGCNPARPAYGTLRCSLDARGARTGASAHAAGPSVCGAALSTPYEGPLPLMLRTRSVLLVTKNGSSLNQDAPPPPTWLVAVGLDPQAARWEVPLDENIAWALTSSTAIAVHPLVPEHLDRVATSAVAALGQRARVRSLHRTERDVARLAFAEMVARVARQEDAP
jgi:hypothetical protein